MAHTYYNLLIHFIFSTKDRAPYIDESIRERLIRYMGGVVREMKGTAEAINAVPDHVHMLISISSDVAAGEMMRVVKTNSSRWVHEQWPGREFAWQEGYAAFTVSESNAGKVKEYIARQIEHHRTISFQEEYLEFLKRHRVEYDPRFIWK